MIDFVKLKIPKGQIPTGHSLVEFAGNRTSNDVVISERFKVINRDEFIIEHREHYTYISLSLHCLWNFVNYDTWTNSNDFGISQLGESINWLVQSFNIDPKKTIPINIESGVNISLSRPVVPVLRNLAIVQSNKRPSTRKNYIKGYFLEYSIGATNRSYEYIKYYSKGGQKGISNHLLRFECKLMRSEKIRTHGINCLEDLTNPQVWISLHNHLMKRVTDLVIVDQLEPFEAMTKPERKNFERMINPVNWQIGNKSKRYREREMFFKTLQKHNLDKLKNEVVDKVNSKITELQKTGTKGTSPLDRKTGTKSTPLENEKTRTKSNLSIVTSHSDLTPNQQQRFEARKCVICCKDISMRSEDTITCSKQCRNKKSNIYNNPRRKILKELKNGTRYLFPLDQIIDLTILENRKLRL